ncbi:MAG: cytochrome c peroxidase, partial [Thalassotalea sp.]|nr:cytochrome c peroxidase [Thalassotalea sp.]
SIILLSGILINQGYAQEGPRRPAPPGQPIPPGQPTPPGQTKLENIDQQLQNIITLQNIQPVDVENIDVLPVTDQKVQLGKKLFFTKNLGGEQSAACVSCHHPMLGGGDNLSLPVGVAAIDELNNQAHDLLGHGRFNENNDHPVVPRNAPSIFNIALYNQGLFWDSRVERTGNGAILTPDSIIDRRGRRQPDQNIPQGATLADAQARFPVTSAEEMRGDFESSANNQTLRSALVSRLNNEIDNISTTWPSEFSQVFGDQQVTVDRVFDAIGEYERSMVFVNNPWKSYLSGDLQAITDSQKQGAILFFTQSQQGGAGCAACHNGSNFSNSRHHLVAFPQIGVGKGNTSNTDTSQDFGRENITGNSNDKFHFRTPSLLNVAATAPYGHSGAYQTLEEVVEHYNNPRRAIERLFAARGQQTSIDGNAPFCQLPQIEQLMVKYNVNCEEVFSDSFANSIEIADYLQEARNNNITASAPLRARPNLSPIQVSQVVDFLHTLTDPCVESRECLTPWIIDDNDLATFPDSQVLEAKDKLGNIL